MLFNSTASSVARKEATRLTMIDFREFSECRTAFCWPYRLLLAIPPSVSRTAFRWLYRLPLAIQPSVGRTTFRWPYRLPLAVPPSVGRTAFRWPYHLPLQCALRNLPKRTLVSLA
ncbi:hypothetical protein GDO86_019867 [Hymenochirus boettgeri]|uniref:Uncharacterized protein n=1 Tax=Hymenochirus boettgeri TaxID=247094 RepID=A0A8T2I8R3_9PIPI|nr:hypothetical protein GDO86_019867 [Hymenochirus boettgeri]